MSRQVRGRVSALVWIGLLIATAAVASTAPNESTQENASTPQTTLPSPKPGCEGTVYLQVVINTDGRVDAARVVRNTGCAELVDMAIAEAKLVPAPVNVGGNRVMARAMIEINFRPDPTFKQALATFHPNPPYTDRARKDRREGTLVLATAVDRTGSVTGVAEVSKRLGKGLDKNAIETVKTWKFQPATSQGRAVPSVVRLSFGFRVSQGSPSGGEVDFKQE